MKAATKEIIRLALCNDESVPSEIAAQGPEILERSVLPQNRSAEPLLMTMIAAAHFLGVSRVTMWRMVKEGVLQPVEITPRVFRIRRQDVQDLASKRSRYDPSPRGNSAG